MKDAVKKGFMVEDHHTSYASIKAITYKNRTEFSVTGIKNVSNVCGGAYYTPSRCSLRQVYGTLEEAVALVRSHAVNRVSVDMKLIGKLDKIVNEWAKLDAQKVLSPTQEKG